MIYSWYDINITFPNAKLNIIGNGILKDQVKKIINNDLKKYNNIIYHGSLSSNEIYEILNSADLFCLPSESETFCCAALESLAIGVPVLLGPCGGPEDFVNNSNGIFMVDNSTSEIILQLNSMLSNIHKYNKRNIAKVIYENYSPDKIIKDYINIYNKIIK